VNLTHLISFLCGVATGMLLIMLSMLVKGAP